MLLFAAILATAWGGIEVARAYGLPPALLFAVSGIAGAVFFPVPTVVAASGFGLFLRVKPLLGKW